MLYGAINNPLKPISDEIKELAALGLDYMEICLDPPLAMPEDNDIDEIKARCEDAGLTTPVAHLPTFVWLADPYESIRQASIMEVIKALDFLAPLGVKKAVLHPGYITGIMNILPEQARELGNNSLAKIVDAARDRGIVICLENMFPKAGQMYKAEEFQQVLADMPDLMMALDLAHACIKAPPDRLMGLIETGGRRIKHIHVSDNSGEEDQHLGVGAGVVDLAGGLSALKARGYDDTMTLEVFFPDRKALAKSLAKVKTMWAEV